MKHIRITRPFGNWNIGDEKSFPDDVADSLVKEGKAVVIQKIGPPKDKKMHTLSDVVDQAREASARGERELLAQASGGSGVVDVKHK